MSGDLPSFAPGHRIGFAHALRGLAALTVVFSHYGQIFWLAPEAIASLTAAPVTPRAMPLWLQVVAHSLPTMFFGHFGVALFFLISGFVIPFSLIGRSRAGFALARVVRIWPTYAAGLGVTVLAVAISARYFGRPLPFGRYSVLLQLLMVRDLAGAPSIDGIVWTLEIEAKFYLLCLLIAPTLRSGRILPLIAISSFISVCSIALSLLPGWGVRSDWPFKALYGFSLSGQMMPFMLIGTVFNFLHRGPPRGRSALSAILPLFGMFSLQWSRGVLPGPAWPGIFSYGVALLVFAACYIRRDQMQRTHRLISRLADISYPLYVVHGIAGYVLMQIVLGQGFSWPIALLLACAWALSAAWLLHWLVEVPTQRLAHRVVNA